MTINLNGASRLFPLLGDPIKYARSPDWLSKHFAKRGMNYVSLPLEVPEGNLDPVMKGLAATMNVDGLSFTMPHKITGVAYMATLSEASELSGVVSAARRNKDGSWHGHATDGDAFVKAQEDRGAVFKGARVLLLGAGGAGTQTLLTLIERGAADIAVCDIDSARAGKVVDLVKDRAAGTVRVADSNDPAGFDIVSNATSMGMDDDDPIPIDPAKLDASMFVGDVIAGHGDTKIIKAAKAAGCKTADGDDMVIAVLDVMCDFLQDAWK